jgi:hypothetical protein
VTHDDRTCKECLEQKPIEEFATYTRGGDRFPLRTCADCYREKERERQRRYLEKNREAHNRRSREYKRERYGRDPDYRDKLRRESKEYYEANKEDVLAKRMDRYRYQDRDEPRRLASRDSVKTYDEEFEEVLAAARGAG